MERLGLPALLAVGADAFVLGTCLVVCLRGVHSAPAQFLPWTHAGTGCLFTRRQAGHLEEEGRAPQQGRQGCQPFPRWRGAGELPCWRGAWVPIALALLLWALR